MQPSFAPVQEDFGALGPKDLFHPLLTTLGIFEVSGPCSRHSGSQALQNKCLCDTRHSIWGGALHVPMVGGSSPERVLSDMRTSQKCKTQFSKPTSWPYPIASTKLEHPHRKPFRFHIAAIVSQYWATSWDRRGLMDGEHKSGKEKAHKHKQVCTVTVSGWCLPTCPGKTEHFLGRTRWCPTSIKCSATAKRGFWKRGNCVKFGFLPLTFLSSSCLWRLFRHLFSNVTPETDPCWTTEGSKTQPLSSLRRASAVRKLAENFRQNAEIVGNCVSHILDVKHCKTRGAENVGKCRKFGRQFSADPCSAECTADPPLHCALLVPILQLRIFVPCDALASQQPTFWTKHLLAELSWSLCAQPRNGK